MQLRVIRVFPAGSILRAERVGPGWAWTDADHLEFNGYVAEAIGADGDMVLTFTGQNSVI